jgi:hypothetical protein
MRVDDSTLSALALQPLPSTLRLDMTGQRYGRLVVESYAYKNAQYVPFWLCRCDCGTQCIVRGISLRRGDTQSCGCWQAESRGKTKRLDLTGEKIGLLRVLAMTWRHAKGHARCRCDCGNEVTVIAGNLMNGHTRSCGCLRMENVVIRKDLTGRTFGRLTVQSMTWKGGESVATCLCACGATCQLASGALLGAHATRSCGCLLSLPIEGLNHKRYRTPEEKQANARFHWRARRARKRGAPYDFTEDDELFMLNYWDNRCAICGRSADFWHWVALDHWMPLRADTVFGTVPSNILPLCHAKRGAGTVPGVRACNNSKGAKDPVTWLTTRLGPRKAAAKLREIAAYFAATRQQRAVPDLNPALESQRL